MRSGRRIERKNNENEAIRKHFTDGIKPREKRSVIAWTATSRTRENGQSSAGRSSGETLPRHLPHSDKEDQRPPARHHHPQTATPNPRQVSARAGQLLYSSEEAGGFKAALAPKKVPVTRPDKRLKSAIKITPMTATTPELFLIRSLCQPSLLNRRPSLREWRRSTQEQPASEAGAQA